MGFFDDFFDNVRKGEQDILDYFKKLVGAKNGQKSQPKPLPKTSKSPKSSQPVSRVSNVKNIQEDFEKRINQIQGNNKLNIIDKAIREPQRRRQQQEVNRQKEVVWHITHRSVAPRTMAQTAKYLQIQAQQEKQVEQQKKKIEQQARQALKNAHNQFIQIAMSKGWSKSEAENMWNSTYKQNVLSQINKQKQNIFSELEAKASFNAGELFSEQVNAKTLSGYLENLRKTKPKVFKDVVAPYKTSSVTNAELAMESGLYFNPSGKKPKATKRFEDYTIPVGEYTNIKLGTTGKIKQYQKQPSASFLMLELTTPHGFYSNIVKPLAKEGISKDEWKSLLLSPASAGSILIGKVYELGRKEGINKETIQSAREDELMWNNGVKGKAEVIGKATFETIPGQLITSYAGGAIAGKAVSAIVSTRAMAPVVAWGVEHPLASKAIGYGIGAAFTAYPAAKIATSKKPLGEKMFDFALLGADFAAFGAGFKSTFKPSITIQKGDIPQKKFVDYSEFTVENSLKKQMGPFTIEATEYRMSQAGKIKMQEGIKIKGDGWVYFKAKGSPRWEPFTYNEYGKVVTSSTPLLTKKAPSTREDIIFGNLIGEKEYSFTFMNKDIRGTQKVYDLFASHRISKTFTVINDNKLIEEGVIGRTITMFGGGGGTTSDFITIRKPISDSLTIEKTGARTISMDNKGWLDLNSYSVLGQTKYIKTKETHIEDLYKIFESQKAKPSNKLGVDFVYYRLITPGAKTEISQPNIPKAERITKTEPQIKESKIEGVKSGKGEVQLTEVMPKTAEPETIATEPIAQLPKMEGFKLSQIEMPTKFIPVKPMPSPFVAPAVEIWSKGVKTINTKEKDLQNDLFGQTNFAFSTTTESSTPTTSQSELQITIEQPTIGQKSAISEPTSLEEQAIEDIIGVGAVGASMTTIGRVGGAPAGLLPPKIFGGITFGKKVRGAPSKGYTPSPIAVFEGITTKKRPKKRVYSGLEIRPIPLKEIVKKHAPMTFAAIEFTKQFGKALVSGNENIAPNYSKFDDLILGGTKHRKKKKSKKSRRRKK